MQLSGSSSLPAAGKSTRASGLRRLAQVATMLNRHCRPVVAILADVAVTVRHGFQATSNYRTIERRLMGVSEHDLRLLGLDRTDMRLPAAHFASLGVDINSIEPVQSLRIWLRDTGRSVGPADRR